MMRVLRDGRALERVARVVVCVGWALRMIGILGGSCWLIEIEMLLKVVVVVDKLQQDLKSCGLC